MPKNTIIVLCVIIMLIIGGIIAFSFLQKEKISSGEQSVSEEEFLEESEEKSNQVFGFLAMISNIDIGNNFLIVKPEADEKKEIKIIIGEETSLEDKVDISDFREGNVIFIKAKTNIIGKTEIDDIEFIRVLP